MAKNGHISVGKDGEQVAVEYLEARDYKVVERNYRQKWGELDIIAVKDSVVHFVEVKSVTWSGGPLVEGVDAYRPEDRVHKNKRARLSRAIRTYLAEKRAPEDAAWTADLVVVYLDVMRKRVKVRILGDILL